MSVSYPLPRPRKGNRLSEVISARDGLARVLEKLGGGEKIRLIRLWQNWEMVMGTDLAPLALPLGHRDVTLLVGAEDNLAMQELTFQTPEILERVNAFMDAPFFQRVEVHLLLGRAPLDIPPVLQPQDRPRPAPARPPALRGTLQLDPESPVGRCYAACLRLHGVANANGPVSRPEKASQSRQ